MTADLVDAYVSWLALTGFRPVSVKARRSCLRAFEVAQVPQQPRRPSGWPARGREGRRTPELHEDERSALWSAFGWPDGMVPTAWLDEQGPMSVPEALWVPEPATNCD